MLAVGIPFLVISTLGWLWAEPRGPRVLAAWLVALTVLSFAALWITDLNMLIIAMPMIGLAVIYCSIAWGVVDRPRCTSGSTSRCARRGGCRADPDLRGQHRLLCPARCSRSSSRG